MSHILPPQPRSTAVKRTFGIVASTYNEIYVNGLLDAVSAEFLSIAPNISQVIVRVPGAFEIPIVVSEMTRKMKLDAIMALGVVIDGETAHGGLISKAVTDSLLQIALHTGIPVIHEVLFVKSEEQAKIRCLGSEINRGTEAARAALAVTESLAQVRAYTKF